ncbi:MAG TPA: hypothetical protein VE983_09615 [Solirubrobacteraceae bacterium]|nr:hypothetical protein [Solirubrobacteraceae bacterium]
MSETATTTRAPQRLQALERANEIRLARAELKRRIACGSLAAAEVILDPPCAAQSWAIGELLMSQRRWGTTRCRKFLLRNQISETKQVGGLTDRQRRLLALQLTPPAVQEAVFTPEPPVASACEPPRLVTGAQEPRLALVPA